MYQQFINYIKYLGGNINLNQKKTKSYDVGIEYKGFFCNIF